MTFNELVGMYPTIPRGYLKHYYDDYYWTSKQSLCNIIETAWNVTKGILRGSTPSQKELVKHKEVVKESKPTTSTVKPSDAQKIDLLGYELLREGTVRIKCDYNHTYRAVCDGTIRHKKVKGRLYVSINDMNNFKCLYKK